MSSKTQNEVSVEIYVTKLSELVHNEANPRTIRRPKHEALKKSLTDFPEMKEIREIVVDENLLILAGDKRAYALEDLGYTDVKVKQVFGLTDRQKREFILKDNDHAGEWDTDILANMWDENEIKDFGIQGFGNIGADDSNTKEKEAAAGRTCVCPTCGYEGGASEFKPTNDN